MSDFVLTLTGPDRVGIVEELTAALLSVGGNVETSRMARLGGEFAVLMLATVPAGAGDALDSALAALSADGYVIALRPTESAPRAAGTESYAYRIEVRGADHEGIVHDIAHGLSARGINIESAETWTTPASTSGAPLFSMNAVVSVPTAVRDTEWMAELAEAAQHANVDVEVFLAEAG